MRIVCPNCGAQYEVPDEVIPAEGRDVQCSNCGDTWYQHHPDHPELATEPEAEAPETTEEAAPERPVPRQPAPREIDPEVSGILREEAERESKLRAREKETLESQTDMGLDSLPADEAGKRSRETRERMAQMRGEDPARDRPRSRLLPEVDEVSSTLRARDEPAPPNSAVAFPVEPPRAGGGFTRGFALVLVIAALLIVAYVQSAKLAEAVPALGPALDAYVAAVDSGRLWLDSKLSGYIPK